MDLAIVFPGADVVPKAKGSASPGGGGGRGGRDRDRGGDDDGGKRRKRRKRARLNPSGVPMQVQPDRTRAGTQRAQRKR